MKHFFQEDKEWPVGIERVVLEALATESQDKNSK